jgi:microsomal dipeptidase-like Zn-dependent dipeptidase
MQTLDLHAHFPMHLGLPRSQGDNVAVDAEQAALLRLLNLFLNNRAGQFRVTPETILEGGIGGLGSVLYDPGDEFQLGHSAPAMAFPHILAQMDNVEQAIEDNAGLELARNPAELEACLVKEQPVLFHCVEGAIALGGDAAHVQELAQRGVAYMIVAHLFFKGAATCANAIPFLTDSEFAKINNQPEGVGLTKHGEDVVEALLQAGIIVDVTHSAELAVDDIFRIYNSRGEYRDRPIISSHNGVRSTSDHPLNLSDTNILRIAATGGVIGIILYPHWLLPPHSSEHVADGFDLMRKAIDHIYQLTGTHNHTAIGTDLDGFITPIPEVQTMKDVPRLEDAITRFYGSEAAEAILRDNALRVLKQGWRGAPSPTPTASTP